MANRQVSAVLAAQLMFIAGVKSSFNALSDVQVAAKGYLEKVFVDWPTQAFDVGVNESGLIVGACPSGRGNEQAGAELRKNALDAGATARNPITVGPKGNVTKTIAAFKRLLSDPTGATTARIAAAELWQKGVAASIRDYTAELNERIAAAERTSDKLCSQIAAWIEAGATADLHTEGQIWSKEKISDLHIPAMQIPAAAADTSDFDWDGYLCEQVGMNRDQILQFIETVEADTEAYIDSRKKPAERPNTPPVINTRRM